MRSNPYTTELSFRIGVRDLELGAGFKARLVDRYCRYWHFDGRHDCALKLMNIYTPVIQGYLNNKKKIEKRKTRGLRELPVMPAKVQVHREVIWLIVLLLMTTFTKLLYYVFQCIALTKTRKFLSVFHIWQKAIISD